MRFVTTGGVLLLLIALFVAGGCGDDPVSPGGSSPKPAHEYEIVLNALVTDSLGGHSFVMMVFDPDSTGVKQTIPFNTSLAAMTTTKDGSRMFVSKTYPKPYEVWSSSWPPTDTLASHAGLAAGQLALSADEQYLLASSGHAVLYALPGLVPVYIDSASADCGAFLPGRTAFCYHRFMNDTVIVVDYGTAPMTVHQQSLRGAGDEPLAIQALCPSAGGDRLIIAAEDTQSNIKYMMVVSTDNLAIIDQVTIAPSFRQMVPVADSGGRYTYWMAKGSTWPAPTPGAIYRYDIQTKELTSILDDSNGGPYLPEEMLVTPDGEYLYVTSVLYLYRMRLSDGQTELVDSIGVSDHQNFAVTVRTTN
ncbi:MAG: hypothetical protein PHR28_03030 [candidate division Zixibacteria bacterium]|nr:hypothetical protein [candidate division Zixibacteria bacterium]